MRVFALGQILSIAKGSLMCPLMEEMIGKDRVIVIDEEGRRG